MAAPTVVTYDAENVATHSATLVGECLVADPSEAISYIIFVWGLTTDYDEFTYWEQTFTGKIHHHGIAGLEPGTTYHFRIIGAARDMRHNGADKEFTTTVVGPPPAPTPFMGWIIDKLTAVAGWFRGIYNIVSGWVWPFYLLAEPFYWLYVWFNSLAWNFYTFSLWVDDIANKIVTILSWDNIKGLFREWLPGLDEVIGWFSERLEWLTTEVKNWWAGAITEIQDLIAIATQGFDSLTIAWDNFWTVIFPELVNLSQLTTWWNSRIKDIQGLIDTALEPWLPLLEDWQDLRDSVITFFTDPLKWLYDRVEDFLDRYW